MIESHTGYKYTTKQETLDFGKLSLKLECLENIDQTIDDLFIVYNEQGRKELFEEMCPYFGIVWPAGRVLAEELARVLQREPDSWPEWLHAQSVLEVGCGLALPSLVLEKANIGVEVIDQHPDVPRFLEQNRKLNGLRGPKVLSGDWKLFDGAKKWDLIFASDVLYDKTQPETLLRFFEQNLSEKGTAIIADPGRGYVQGFLDMAYERGFVVHTHGVFGVLIGELSRRIV